MTTIPRTRVEASDMGMQWGTAGSYPAIYEELMVPAFFRFYAEDLIARAALQPGERLLDVACGTGVVPRAAGSTGTDLSRITGLDRTPGMLAVAAEVAGDLEVDWVEGDATAMTFDDASFDVVTCQQGLQFFPDRPKALAEFRRVLAPGGRALIACWTELAEQTAHAAYMRSIAGPEPDLAAVGSAPFALGDADELTGLLRDVGFEDVAVARVPHVARFQSAESFVRSFAEGSPLALALAALPAGRADDLRAAALPNLTEFEDERGLAAPMATLVVTGRA